VAIIYLLQGNDAVLPLVTAIVVLTVTGSFAMAGTVCAPLGDMERDGLRHRFVFWYPQISCSNLENLRHHSAYALAGCGLWFAGKLMNAETLVVT